MDKVINLGIPWNSIPHVGELIFESTDTPGLIKCLEVSETWKVLAGNVLIKRSKGKLLEESCQNGETKVVELLLEYSNAEESGLNTRDIFGMTPFMWACSRGYKDVVQLLLDHSERFELNARDDNGWTAFMWACFNERKDVVKLFLHHSTRIDMNARDNNGLTAFMRTCKYGSKDVIQSFLDHSERFVLNERDNNGKTALMLASIYGYKDVVELIKSKLNL